MNVESKLRLDAVVEYLRDRDDIVIGADATVESLGGGVSNSVFRVQGDQCVVLKQPLANLAVEDDWPADVARVHNEAAAAQAYAEILDRDIAADAPRVVFEDHAMHVIAIECAPESTTMWKHELLRGAVDADIAHLMGRVLGTIHATTAGDDDLREAFVSKRPFEQLRIDPYHRTVARRHPDVADHIHAEIDRITSVEKTLVHGDYSPKNVLVNHPESNSNVNSTDAETESDARVWVLDFEVAHWGDPAFDTAFMLNHLFIKSVYNHPQQDAYIDAALAFWMAYNDVVDWEIEHETVTELAILMLARVDGKSPVEYIDEGPVSDVLRRIAKRALQMDMHSQMFDAFVDLVVEESEEL